MKNIFKYFLLVPMVVAGMNALAQGAPAVAEAAVQVERYSPYKDPVFYALVAVAVILLAFIMQLQKVFAGVARNAAAGKKGIFPVIILLLGLTQLPNGAMAAERQAAFLHEGFGSNAFNALIFLIIVEMAVVVYYVRMIQLLVSKQEAELPVTAAAPVLRPSFWERFNKSVAVEKEAAILTDHDYDGIRELDNSLPPWWKYGFYLTIVWAAVYLVHFHVSKTGPLQIDEYKNQLAEAEIEMEEYRKRASNLVDETNVVVLTEAAALAKGKEVFTSMCATCHGVSGEGKVGPNLTDQYWKHGGDIKDVFKTIKLGVSGTGMKSWKADMSPSVMAQVASYILTLQGTNPAGAKAPEGNLYTPASEEAPATGDQTEAKKDSITVAEVRFNH